MAPPSKVDDGAANHVYGATRQGTLAMVHLGNAGIGRFCWFDLAAADAGSAKRFYGEVFGWTPLEQSANGGSFTRMLLSGDDVGSVYQMNQYHLAQGLPSHWTPYIRVDDAEDAARRAATFGAKVIVRPFEVARIARIALILDPVGANVGLWEPIDASAREEAYG